ncbi:bifunctional protein folC [Coccidioides immitis RMSCC 3703]|uniref:tetrahydrofolate synthase n=1 Tax=Coccidioides immitis RMSCC 3703 TaxID=454286 RepID=A0A0J8QYN7_COCIT|nr:bifunctional protein folC [Coccidioides immitis RMSCC 3703]
MLCGCSYGFKNEDVNNLNIIHVAGTKGKGSTCAFTRAFLRAHGQRTGFPKRIGLYTSPHLQCIRERIQIDDHAITEDLFTKYFFEVWECVTSPYLGQGVESELQPRYLQFLALLAFHTFIREKVEATIFETHHGGEYDATNVIQKPIATGITSLGMDHVAQLGPTAENIAWHKAGIFKPGAPAFSAPQEFGPAEVMIKRATERNTTVKFVSADDCLPTDGRVLSVPVQRLNCSLALELARTFLQCKASGHMINADDVSNGVANFSWAGRFEVINHGESQWFVDGAHNTLSLQHAAEWFAKNTSASSVHKHYILIFSHFSEDRDGIELVECLAHALFKTNVKPDYVIFSTYQEKEDGSTRIDSILKVPEAPFPEPCATYSSLWKVLDPQAIVTSVPTIEGAIKLAKKIGAQGGGMQTLVTGSLYLVGGALNVLQS